jgi:hypothetical protein
LVSWWPGNGNYKDVVSGNNGTPYGGVAFAPAVYGDGFFFNGTSARIFVPDVPSLAITGSMTISAWLWLASYPSQSGSGQAQILFRGDDRINFDPYYLSVISGSGYPGDLQFHIGDASGNRADLYAPVPLGKYVFVAATLDDATGKMSLYENGKLVAHTVTTIRPYAELDQSATPGLGIGNVQSRNYTEYFAGIIDDLKIYDTDDPQITPVKLSLNHSTVKGGATVTALLTLNDSPIVPTPVATSSTLAAAIVPATVRIAAGHYNLAIAIKTQAVTTSQSGQIVVTLNGKTVMADLTVTP